MRNTAIHSAVVVLLSMGWICGQDGQSKPAEPPAAPTQNAAREPQSLPPGPVGLQPDMMKPAAGEKDSEAKDNKPPVPAPPAADPVKMAAPPPAGPGGKIPGTVDLDQKTYTIGAEDVLTVMVWNQTNLSGTHTVRPDGRISVPLAGEILAAGMTPQQLETAVADRLKAANLILDPRVSVGLQAVHSKKYFIQGEVNHPGSFDLVVPLRVMEALVSAGGFKDFADTKHIVILRDNKQLKFNFKDAVGGKHPEQNIYLQDHDIIVVK